ncbi:MAG: DUF4381 domain-containing protein [Candidatus Endonucleobacter bathymodioli]|uniref:DUF4381 domain-containing protein n=1 Tax=Candidatus Endonucleibacter bathymodioli TaxID=539814 RepID=A0AA90SSW4_9GAMM|nr:DUF4381 domain-containing protein [Candidatus Endonucleobacter bathymodioli]
MDQQTFLEQLRPNQLPDAIGYWPPAAGWWFVAGSLMAIILLVLMVIVNHRRKNRYRRTGLKQAKRVFHNYTNHGNNRLFAHDCNRLLKKVALHIFPRQDIASLNGKEWLDFLYRSSGNEEFKSVTAEALGANRFKPDQEPDVTQLHPLTISWIKKHHA